MREPEIEGEEAKGRRGLEKPEQRERAVVINPTRAGLFCPCVPPNIQYTSYNHLHLSLSIPLLLSLLPHHLISQMAYVTMSLLCRTWKQKPDRFFFFLSKVWLIDYFITLFSRFFFCGIFFTECFFLQGFNETHLMSYRSKFFYYFFIIFLDQFVSIVNLSWRCNVEHIFEY